MKFNKFYVAILQAQLHVGLSRFKSPIFLLEILFKSTHYFEIYPSIPVILFTAVYSQNYSGINLKIFVAHCN